MRIVTLISMLLLGACASRGAEREVAAVVQDEGARQAAATAAANGEDSTRALKAGAEAAARDKDASEPPL